MFTYLRLPQVSVSDVRFDTTGKLGEDVLPIISNSGGSLLQIL
jgi:hypothetical protein